MPGFLKDVHTCIKVVKKITMEYLIEREYLEVIPDNGLGQFYDRLCWRLKNFRITDHPS